MATVDDLLRPFARAIHAKVTTLSNDALSLSTSQRARILESISDDIKKCSNFIEPEVSEAALAEAEQIHEDLYIKNWHDQPSFDAGREMFHFEHVVPVSAVRKACVSAKDEDGTMHILKTRLRVAWILKSEDAELTRLGHRSNRPDPDGAYRNAGIRLVPKKRG